MKKFHFRLDRLLHIRRIIEREQARVLQEVMNEVAGLRAEHQARIEERVAIAEQIGCGVVGKTPAGAVANMDLVIYAADRRVEESARSVRQAEEKAGQEAARYRDARRDLKAVEKMKERKRDAWSVEAARSEQREFDEIAGRTRAWSGGSNT